MRVQHVGVKFADTRRRLIRELEDRRPTATPSGIDGQDLDVISL